MENILSKDQLRIFYKKNMRNITIYPTTKALPGNSDFLTSSDMELDTIVI